ncbi:MAG: GNAT family N-acetyltransferase [Ruminococcaceae bacterium]|nr:GNAT family N-acetyltransferase [Oscillospiraceae bacterium]
MENIVIQSERLTPEEYIEFLRHTDLGSQYPKERFENRIATLVEKTAISLTARNEDGLLVGVLFAITDFSYWMFLTDLGIRREYVKRGIGKALVERAIEEAGGLENIIVYTCANDKAIPFYKKLGMEQGPEDVFVLNQIEWTDFVVE